MDKKNKKLFRLLMLGSVFILPAIHLNNSYAASKPATYTIQKGQVSKVLYYTGIISPIRNVPVTSPTQGVVNKIDFIYGQLVKKDQVLVHVESQKILNNYRDSRVAYLKALDDYNQKIDWHESSDVLNAQDSLVKSKRSLTQALNSYQENQKLYKLGIVSHSALTQSKNSYEDGKTSYEQAQRSLKAVLKKGLGDNLLMSKLALANAKAKYESLKSQVDSHSIKAPAAGIVLKPDTGDSSDGSDGSKKSSGKLTVGSTVQFQEVLVNIGDMSGLQLNFKIPEININEIKTGDPATITGAGFPGITLKGTVTNIGAQANSGGGGTLPTFPAMVIVKKLTAKQKKWIRSGMDAQIAISVYKAGNQITVPVSAVHQNKDGSAYVNLFNNGKSTKQVVTTGKVDGLNVQVLSGVKAGQTVELAD